MNSSYTLMRPIFKCQTDEGVFFQRLSAISGIQKVIEHEDKITVSISDQPQNTTLEQLHDIANMWHITFTLTTSSL